MIDFKHYFKTIIKTFNPESYSELNSRTFTSTIKYYLFLTTLAVIAMIILFIPLIIGFGSYYDKGSNHFESLTITTNYNLKESFNMLSDPIIRFDNNKTNMTEEKILLTNNQLHYKKYFFFGKEKIIPLSEGINLKSDSTKNLLSMSLIFLIPSILFWGTIFFSIYFIILIIITTIIFKTFIWALRSKIPLRIILKTATYSSTILIILQLLLMPFYRMILIPLIAYWILLAIILFMISEHFEDNVYGSRQAMNSGNNNNKNMWGKNRNDDDDVAYNVGKKSSFGNSGIKNKKVAFDEDDDAPIIKKKKKSYDEENDGYVEWK